jgi:hypothetical protein
VKTREVAERRLEAAERELGRLGPLRRRRRDELRAEVELQRHAIEVADERLGEAVSLVEETKLKMRRADRSRAGRIQEVEPVGRTRERAGLTLER